MSSIQSKFVTFKDKLKFHDYWVDILVVTVFVLATIIINLQMIRYGLNGLGDVRWHITWIQHFSQQLNEGIWYPRWLGGTNFGYGSPTFVFYPPLVYYIGSILKLLGLNSEQTMTAVFSLPIFLSGLTFYIYGKNKWGKIASFGGALSYMLAPFLIGFVNAGGLSTIWALPWIPLGLYLTDKSIEKSEYRVFLALFVTIVALTHTPSLLIYAIAWFIYILLQFINKPFKNVILTIIAVVLGLGIASLYLLPAILEQKYVNIDYQFGSKGGFLTLNMSNLFKSGWSDPNFKNLTATIALALISLICWWRNKQEVRNILGWLAFILIVFFMISNWSEFIWYSSNTLLKIQRSGRLFGLFYFGQAALVAIAIKGIFNLNWQWKFFPLIIILSIFLMNFQYGYKISRQSPGLHSPGKGKVFIKEWMEIALFDPYSDKLIDVPEYRPLLPNANTNFAPDIRERYTNQTPIPYVEGGEAYFPVPQMETPKVAVIRGEAEIDMEKWSNYQRNFNIKATQPSIIKLRTYYYPAWKLYVNGQSYPITMSDDGTITLEVKPGDYQAELSYQSTNAFNIGKILSLVSLIALGIFQFKFGFSAAK